MAQALRTKSLEQMTEKELVDEIFGCFERMDDIERRHPL